MGYTKESRSPNTLKRFLKYISLGALSQMRHYWAVLFGERFTSGSRKESMEKHPVELTYEEMQGMSLEEIKEMRDKSMKLLEESFKDIEKKKKQERMQVMDAIDTVAGTCIGLHKRLEVLEAMVKQLIHEQGYEVEFGKENKIPKEKLN